MKDSYVQRCGVAWYGCNRYVREKLIPVIASSRNWTTVGYCDQSGEALIRAASAAGRNDCFLTHSFLDLIENPLVDIIISSQALSTSQRTTVTTMYAQHSRPLVLQRPLTDTASLAQNCIIPFNPFLYQVCSQELRQFHRKMSQAHKGTLSLQLLIATHTTALELLEILLMLQQTLAVPPVQQVQLHAATTTTGCCNELSISCAAQTRLITSLCHTHSPVDRSAFLNALDAATHRLSLTQRGHRSR